MKRRSLYTLVAALLLTTTLAVYLFLGSHPTNYLGLLNSILQMQAQSYDEAVLLFQRLPRGLIAIYVGGIAATSGFVLQSLLHNPLASPATLGVNSGAALALVTGALIFNFGAVTQALAALCGAAAGFLLCILVARIAGRQNDPRGLSLILSGALMSLFLTGLTNALLLSDPSRRADFLSWIIGNINHAYFDRLQMFWWVGALCLITLFVLARPLTLILLGVEKAASTGVNVPIVSRIALLAAVLGSGSAVAVCGPIGFVGLVVPHIIRPLVGNSFIFALPVSAMTGATVCLLADLFAREALRPYVLSTGLVTDLLGGIAFLLIVKRYYLAADKSGVA